MFGTRFARYGIVFAVLFGGLILTTQHADAACNTKDAGCSGQARFFNTKAAVGCFSVRPAKGQKIDFCLKKNEKRVVKVKTGDRYCYRAENKPPPAKCTLLFINVD